MPIEARYSLPFDTSKLPIRISQGNNGPWSHQLLQREIPTRPGVFMETDLIYAVDFALPLGSEIRAAKDGVVFDYYLGGDWCYQGLDPEIGNNPPPLSTNFMILMHEDGTMTWYSHLSNEVLVKRGQVIKKGEIIAKSGLSGWVAGIPHVHFQANTRALPRNSTPILFEEWPYPLDHNTLDKQGKIWWG